MFRRMPIDVLEISIDGERYDFQSPRDFEFALSGRICVPAPKIAALSRLSDNELLREAEAIRAVEQRFAEALSGALEDITTVGPLLKNMEPSIISQDNSWRSIISALNGLDRIPESYKKIALVKYMQYLTSRQEVVKTLYANRRPREAAQDRPAIAEAVYRPTARFRETMLFNLNGAADLERQEISFSRLPKGETVEVNLEEDRAIDLLLAKHQCRILLRDRLLFVDQNGHNSELRTGRNIVGRDATSDVIMDADLRDVSRKHLIVESDGMQQIKLTDISSHGTSLPPRFLDHTSI
ncbi:MAG: FHA domain-containing protein [Gammaproteobacteria bacterium]|nr:MAG: FHA domain-containing protein [Gammaproteobacteria bacterium]